MDITQNQIKDQMPMLLIPIERPGSGLLQPLGQFGASVIWDGNRPVPILTNIHMPINSKAVLDSMVLFIFLK